YPLSCQFFTTSETRGCVSGWRMKMTAHDIIDTANEDFITIIAPSMAEVMDSFRNQGLAERDYSIVHAPDATASRWRAGRSCSTAPRWSPRRSRGGDRAVGIVRAETPPTPHPP